MAIFLSLVVAVVVIAIIVTLVLAGGTAGATRRQTQRVDEVESSDVAKLRYLVPKGQDPAAIVVALQHEGYEAVAEGEFIVVPLHTDPDRERAHIRSVIGSADATIEGDSSPDHEVRFTDER